MSVSLTSAIGVLLRPLLFMLYFLSGFMPRNPHKWVFGSWSGKRFADNAAALYEYVASLGNGRIEPIWISSDPAIVARLRALGYTAHRTWSLQGVAACLTAGVYVFDGLTKDVNHWLSRGAKRVLLRHGVGIKKVERAIEHKGHRLYQLFYGSIWQRIFWSILLPWHRVRPDMLIATSPDHAEQGQIYYDVRPERMVITGFPRNDRLMRGLSEPEDGKVQAVLEALRRRNIPAFLYLPTFRDVDSGFEFPLEELNAMAARLGIVLLVKLHFVDGMRNRAYESGSDNYLLLVDAGIDPNLLFRAVDGLISDYSSVTFDFMLTWKPVLFFVPDLAEYLRDSRSFYYDFDQVTPGPKPRTVNELEVELRSILENGMGEWREKYDEVLQRFHTYRDAGASERVYAEIMQRFVRLPAQ